MYNSIDKPILNNNLGLTEVFDIKENQSEQSQASKCFGRSVKICKTTLNCLGHGCILLGGVGIMVNAVVQPLMSYSLSQTHLDSSSLCYNETETRIDVYGQQTVRASFFAGLFSGSITSILVGAYYLGEYTER